VIFLADWVPRLWTGDLEGCDVLNERTIAKALTERYQVLGSIFHSERSPLLDPPITINLTPITWLFETSPTPILSNLASGLS